MTISVRELLATDGLRLQLVSDPVEVAEQLGAAVAWVHSSDLVDPTPFLDAGHVLLTDGTQWSPGKVDDVDAYVLRLARHGILALGFATQVVHGAVPTALRESCARHGLVLFEVPERIPFIAIIRRVADAIAAGQHTALTHRLDALRAIARAARRPDALAATLRELERLLETWVSLYDASGEPVRIPALRGTPAELRDEVRTAVETALARPHASALSLPGTPPRATLQTIGAADRRIGVLVIGEGASDPSRTERIGTAVAVAHVALSHEHSLVEARLDVRSAALELLLRGSVDDAARVMHALGGSVPKGAVVAVVASAEQRALLARTLETWAAGRGRFFAIRDDEAVVVCRESALASALAALESAGRAIGVSRVAPLTQLAASVHSARRARHASEQSGGTVHVDSLLARGHLALIPESDAIVLAEHTLAPLRAATTSDGAPLLDTVVQWMRNDCAWGRTAAELGVHRHSVRSRVDAASAALGEDLDTAAGRARLWTALALGGLL